MPKAPITIAAIFCALSLAAGDAPQIHSYSARAAIEKRDGAVKRAYQEYLSKLLAADKQLLSALDLSLREAMNKSDLNEATAINELKKQTAEQLDSAEKGDSTFRWVGTRWKWLGKENDLVTFQPDGTFKASFWPSPGRWEAVDDHTVMILTWQKTRMQVTFASDLQRLFFVPLPTGNIGYAVRAAAP